MIGSFLNARATLVVAVGIMVTWRDYVSLLGNVEKFYEKEIKRRLAHFYASRPSSLIAGAMHDGDREQIEAASSHITEHIAMLRLRLRTTEAAIIIVGTVVQGYGSFIGRLL